MLDTSPLYNPALDFSVTTAPMLTLGPNGDYVEVPDHMRRALIRTDTNEVLATCGPSYKPLEHGQVIASVNDALVRAGFDINAITVKDHIANNGARMRRELVFQDHNQTIAGSGDRTSLKLDILNSYDGSYAYHSVFGQFRWMCLNGLVSGSWFIRTRRLHTGRVGVSMEAEVKKLENAREFFTEQGDQMRRWLGTPVANDGVETLFKRTLAALPTRADPDNINGTQFEVLLRLWDKNAQDLGSRSLYAAYNAATEWSTHMADAKRVPANVDLKRLGRENKVAEMLRSPEWKALEAA